MKKEQASSTAYTVLQGMMLIAQKPEFTHLVSERNGQLGEMILNSSDEGKKRLKQIKE